MPTLQSVCKSRTRKHPIASGLRMDGGRGKPHRADRSRSANAGIPDGVASYYELTATDRLGLLERCSKELRRRALLIDPDRVFELCALRIALTEGSSPRSIGDSLSRESASPGDEERDESWIVRRIAAAIDQARRDDAELASRGMPLDDGQDYRFLTDVFFVPPGAGALAANAFNQLPRSTRRATLELLLYGKTIEQCLAENLARDVESLTGQARKGLLAIMQIDEAMLRNTSRKASALEEGDDS